MINIKSAKAALLLGATSMNCSWDTCAEEDSEVTEGLNMHKEGNDSVFSSSLNPPVPMTSFRCHSLSTAILSGLKGPSAFLIVQDATSQNTFLHPGMLRTLG